MALPLILSQEPRGWSQRNPLTVWGKDEPGGVADKGMKLGGPVAGSHGDQEEGLLKKMEQIWSYHEVGALQKGEDLTEGPEDGRPLMRRTLEKHPPLHKIPKPTAEVQVKTKP